MYSRNLDIKTNQRKHLQDKAIVKELFHQMSPAVTVICAQNISESFLQLAMTSATSRGSVQIGRVELCNSESCLYLRSSRLTNSMTSCMKVFLLPLQKITYAQLAKQWAYPLPQLIVCSTAVAHCLYCHINIIDWTDSFVSHYYHFSQNNIVCVITSLRAGQAGNPGSIPSKDGGFFFSLKS